MADLRRASSAIDSGLRSGTLKEKKNAEVHTKVVSRNVDLVLHVGDSGPGLSVLTSVENKTIMAAHGKARKNRVGDLVAYSNHMHNHRRDCIAAGVMVINISATYENPDPFAKRAHAPEIRHAQGHRRHDTAIRGSTAEEQP